MTQDRFFQIKDAIAKLIENTEFADKTFIVGGAVRDLLMDKEIKDIDIVVNLQGGGLKLARYLYDNGILVREPVEYPQYSVSMFVLKEFPDIEIEAVQTRKETYNDYGSRNPDTAFGSIEDDCIRRDLTINALYLNVSNGEIYDYVNGKSDINNHIIRVTNDDPDTVFIDDPLRIMRVVRFASRFGWEIQKQTFRAMKRNVDRLNIISIERINDEFSKIITCDNPKMALNMLREIGAIKYIIPELENLYECRQNEFHGFDTVWEHTVNFIQILKSNNLILRLAALLHDIGKPDTKTTGKDGKVHFYGHEYASAKIAKEALTRLRYSNDIIKEVAFYVENHMWFFSFKSECPNDKVVRRVQYYCNTVERYENLMKLMQADRMSVPDKYKEPDFFDNIMSYNLKMCLNGTALFEYKLPVDGNDIMRIKGIAGGHDVKVIKEALITYVIKCNPKMTRESAIKFIKGYQLNK